MRPSIRRRRTAVVARRSVDKCPPRWHDPRRRVKTLNRNYVRNDRVVCREVAGETILVPVCAGVAKLNAIYVLNPVGAAIWRGLASAGSGQELANRIADEFDAAPETAEHDVKVFLEDLVAELPIRRCGALNGREDYSAFGLRLARNSASRRIPVAATLELTHRCPFRCRHCANRLPLDDPQALQNELRSDELDRVLGELANLGCCGCSSPAASPCAAPTSSTFTSCATARPARHPVHQRDARR